MKNMKKILLSLGSVAAIAAPVAAVVACGDKSSPKYDSLIEALTSTELKLPATDAIDVDAYEQVIDQAYDESGHKVIDTMVDNDNYFTFDKNKGVITKVAPTNTGAKKLIKGSGSSGSNDNKYYWDTKSQNNEVKYINIKIQNQQKHLQQD